MWHRPTDKWQTIWGKVTGKGIKVAILDTGITSHPDLPTPIVNKSYIRGESANDGNGHGTHCAGISVGRNGVGAAPNAELMNYKVLSNGGSGSSSGIAKAVRDAVNDGANIISMSLGGGGPDKETNDNIDYALSNGVLVFVAAGNSGYNGSGNTIGWPGRHRTAICVGAIQSNGQIANFSSGGPEMECSSPGHNIISCGLRSNYVSMSGTSMATPDAAGKGALMYEAMFREGYSAISIMDEITNRIKRYTEDAGKPGFDNSHGYGILSIDKILSDVLTGIVGV
jgi:subtilisin family serine protease